MVEHCRGFRLALPMTWFDVDVDPRTRRESISGLISERAPGVDHAGGAGRLAAVIEGAAAEAQRRGAVLAALFADVVDGRPVSASLVASVVRGRRGNESVDVIAGLVAELDGDVVELPAGRAVRCRPRQRADAGDGPSLEVEIVDFYVPVPGEADVVLLSFSTPNLDAGDAFAALFESLASSLRFGP